MLLLKVLQMRAVAVMTEKGGRRSWGAGGLEELWQHSCEVFPCFLLRTDARGHI